MTLQRIQERPSFNNMDEMEHFQQDGKLNFGVELYYILKIMTLQRSQEHPHSLKNMEETAHFQASWKGDFYLEINFPKLKINYITKILK